MAIFQRVNYLYKKFYHRPPNIYLFKVNYRNKRKRCEICLKLTIKTLERRQRRYGVFIVNFEHISHLFLVFLLKTLTGICLLEEAFWQFFMHCKVNWKYLGRCCRRLFNLLMHNVPKWSDTVSNLQDLLSDDVSDHFGTLCINTVFVIHLYEYRSHFMKAKISYIKSLWCYGGKELKMLLYYVFP